MQWSLSTRPYKLDDVVGNDKVKTYFKKCYKSKDWPAGVIFQGKYGSGKTTMAQIVAMMMVCQHPDKDGNPCCECDSCKEIMNGTYRRDVIQIDSAGDEGYKAEITKRLSSFVQSAPLHDSHKVVMVEEYQALSADAIQSFLKILEKRPYIHFIFTGMVDKTQNTKSDKVVAAFGALASRVPVFMMEAASTYNTMMYLHDILVKQNIDSDESIPKYIKMEGLALIAQNSENSYRKAVQMLEQCIKSEAYTKEDMEKLLNIRDEDDYYNLLTSIVSGKATKDTLDLLVQDDDVATTFNYMYNLLSSAAQYRTFNTVYMPKYIKSDFLEKKIVANAAALANNKNFDILLKGFESLNSSFSSYFNRSQYIIGMCNIISLCKNNSLKEQATRPTIPVRGSIPVRGAKND
jgi:DNA polymerase III subunit gamma/tau